MPDQELLAERVSTVIRRNLHSDGPGAIDRNQLTIILGVNGDFTPEMVDQGIERALEKGLIEEQDDGFVPGR